MKANLPDGAKSSVQVSFCLAFCQLFNIKREDKRDACCCVWVGFDIYYCVF